MYRVLCACCLAALAAGSNSIAIAGQQVTPRNSSQVPTPTGKVGPPDQPAQNLAAQSEDQELALLIQESNRSPVDFVRDLEKFLQKYPSAKRKNEITRGLFQASRDLKDNRRIATYGERLLATDPNDISVLGVTGRALNTFDDPAR